MHPSAPLTITFLIDSMQARAGMERVTARVASGLAERGYRVQIVALRGQHSAFPLHPGVQLCRLDLPPGPLRLGADALTFVRAIRRQLHQLRPDVLVMVDSFLSAFALPACLGLRAASGRRIRRVAWEHFHLGFDFGMRSRRLAHHLAALLSDRVCVLTEQDVHQWARAYPLARGRIRSMPNPLSFPLLPQNPYSAASRTVLAMGRLDGQKGFDLLTQAWAQVEAQMLRRPELAQWSLRIVGVGADEAALRRQARRLGLRRWRLEPATDRVEEAFLDAGVYALSSRNEGLPMVLMESQAYGVPAVAFDCPTGPAELLGPGGGVLVEAGNVQALAEALCRVMGDVPLREQLSQRAFQHSARYDARRILDEWVTFLGTLPAGQRHLLPLPRHPSGTAS